MLCKGIITGLCPAYHDLGNGRNMLVGTLPEDCCPRDTLHFAAPMWETSTPAGRSETNVNLVTLLVTRDGMIHATSTVDREGAIDLSAVRFSRESGISLIDGVRLHTCDFNGTRLVMVQGSLKERHFAFDSAKPLTKLPECCRPPTEMPFIVSGTRSGSFHLLEVKPKGDGPLSNGGRKGLGGEVYWSDSIWNRDSIHLSGLVWQTAEETLQYILEMNTYSVYRRRIVIEEFQKLLKRKWNNLEDAWYKAFDVNDDGRINFTEFAYGCKMSFYVGDTTRLWQMLDEDGGGDISYCEFSQDVLAGKRTRDRRATDGGGL